ncbi:target of rapamycin complex 2 subunit MAPKAP1-like [Styela clava]
MAMLDNPDWLLDHIRHSFITSDDTGMCEMVLQDNDMMTLSQHRLRIKELKEAKRIERAKKNQKKGLPESFGRSTPVGSPRRTPSESSTTSSSNPVIDADSSEALSPLAPSPDILSGWDFGVRRRSNTAQKLERIRKERQSRVKVNNVPWRKKNPKITEEQLNTMFEKKRLNDDEVFTSDDISTTLSRVKFSANVISSTTLPSNSEETKHYGFAVKDDHSNSPTVDGFVLQIPVPHLSNHISTNGLPEIITSNEVGTYSKKKNAISALSTLLITQSTDQYDNPFREYSKFDGPGQTAGVKKVDIFVWPYGAEKPRFAMLVSVLAQKAKVQDVIGLTCWKYLVENQEPPLTGKTVQRFSLHIAEDDGTVDTDFPPLDPTEPFSKFSFATLSLVEKKITSDEDDDDESGVKETVFVKVNDFGGSSLVRVDDLSITMGEILKKTLKKRKGQTYTGRYRLEYQDRVGVAVDEDQTLESTGTMEFYLVREHSSRNNYMSNTFDGSIKTMSSGLSPPNEDEYKFPPTQRTPSQSDNSFIFVPTMEYVTFRFYQSHKVRPATPVDFSVGPSQVDIEPVDRRETRSTFAIFLSPRKTLSIRVSMLAYCAIHDSKNRANSLSVSPSSSSGSFSSSMSSFVNQDTISTKSTDKSIFKLYYKLSENHTDFKHLTLEGPSDDVQDAVERVRNVMMLNGDRNLQGIFEAIKFGIPQSTSSVSNSTSAKRKGSIFR